MHARAAQARGRSARVRARIAHMVDFHRRDAHALSVSRKPRPDSPALPRFSSARPMSTTCRWEDRSRLGPRSDLAEIRSLGRTRERHVSRARDTTGAIFLNVYYYYSYYYVGGGLAVF